MGDSNLVIKNDSFIQSMHNDIQCIESIDPSDKGTSRQYWFTANILANIFDISLNTAKNHIDSLIEWGALTVVKNLTTVQTQNNAGAVLEALYAKMVKTMSVLQKHNVGMLRHSR